MQKRFLFGSLLAARRGLDFRHFVMDERCQISTARRKLSSSQLATALRPFYFAVHPDLFGQHPEERAVNENSLKQLTVFIETVQSNRPIRPTKFKFYLKALPMSKISAKEENALRAINITLLSRDLRATIHHILCACDLPTSYLDSLPGADNRKGNNLRPWLEAVHLRRHRGHEHQKGDRRWPSSSSVGDDDLGGIEMELDQRPDESLRAWLTNNSSTAKSRLETTQATREETERLRLELKSRLELADILWSCGWGIAHFKGCLQGLENLRQHHPVVLRNLSGRTVAFGNLTGVSLDGHVILSSGDVRHSWLDLIKTVREQDLILLRLPAIEKTVSRVLFDIQVVHRKFQPAVEAHNYEIQLRTLSASIADFWVKNGLPKTWPASLSAFQLVVECDAGPLMLSPTGQFLVPASCPAFLIANFITKNLAEANARLESYKVNKYQEEELYDQCRRELGLAGLEKDDNVTPDRMIQCCRRLLQRRDSLISCLKGTRLYVTHFYSVLQDGEMCLPWNWEY